MLPHDEWSVRADGDDGVAWLLPEDSTERLRQRASYDDSDGPPGWSHSNLADRFRTAESERYRRPLG